MALMTVATSTVLAGADELPDEGKRTVRPVHEAVGHEQTQTVHLSAEQRDLAGIASQVLVAQRSAGTIRAPGEVRLNGYLTSRVTPRVAAQVVTRHARLGDQVVTGQPLATLSSVEVAQAQADLLNSEREWLRVKQLGRGLVSDRRYTQARVARQLARARLLAFGMTHKQVETLASADAGKATGSFQMVAAQPGTVIRDDFVLGEFIQPGRVMFEISDERRLWVEASLTPEQRLGVAIGSEATIIVNGETFTGRVTQIHHALDENTRTLAVRLEVANPQDRLHPGLFVDVRIPDHSAVPVLAVPKEALLRGPDGDWRVFFEHSTGEYEPAEVEVLRTTDGMSVIRGLEPGIRIVTKGAFFLQSELAKAGFESHHD